MNVEYINAFYQAINEVLKMMLNVDVQMGKASLRNEFIDENRTGILLSLTGDLDGYVFFVFPNETALKIVNNMSGLEMEDVDEFVYSALSEIVNIISGNAVTLITSTGNICDISTPKVYEEGFEEAIQEDTVPLRIPIENDMGEFEMYIHIVERK